MDRLLWLLRRWQDMGTWSVAFGAADEWRRELKRHGELWAALREAKSPEHVERFGESAEYVDNLTIAIAGAHLVFTTARKNLDEWRAELVEVANLLRERCPQALAELPAVDLLGERPTDLAVLAKAFLAAESVVLATALMTGGGKQEPPKVIYSQDMRSLLDWLPVFGSRKTEQNRRRLKARIDAGSLRALQVSQRAWRIAVEDLPEGHFESPKHLRVDAS